ncbi:hypothetical protein CMI41_04870, partial [Candidatus Pacearchaeota archaeon]|nr:hypothetical protein [Candidatus Pacearchaeota archaeon]
FFYRRISPRKREFVKLLDFFGAEYGWSKRDLMDLTLSEVDEIQRVVNRRRRKQSGSQGRSARRSFR